MKDWAAGTAIPARKPGGSGRGISTRRMASRRRGEFGIGAGGHGAGVDVAGGGHDHRLGAATISPGTAAARKTSHLGAGCGVGRVEQPGYGRRALGGEP